MDSTMSKGYLALLVPLAAALTMMVVIARTPAPHTALLVATSVCMAIVLIGVAIRPKKSRN